jgi:hypothetical protein
LLIISGVIQALIPEAPERLQKTTTTPSTEKAGRDPLVLATVGIVLATALSAVVLFLQYCLLRDTLTANKLDNRAWVSVKIETDGAFSYSLNRGAEIPLRVTISNVGHEPAFNILPAVDFLSFVKTTDGKSNTKITDQQREICDKLRKIKIGSPEDIGQSLLPNETRTFPTFKVRKTGPELQAFLASSTFDLENFTVFIGGCFDYTFLGGEGGHHQTGFIYMLNRKNRMFHLSDESTPAALMDLEPWADVGFGFYAD